MKRRVRTSQPTLLCKRKILRNRQVLSTYIMFSTGIEDPKPRFSFSSFRSLSHDAAHVLAVTGVALSTHYFVTATTENPLPAHAVDSKKIKHSK